MNVNVTIDWANHNNYILLNARLFDPKKYNPKDQRIGSSEDVKKLCGLFKLLNYEVEVHSNLSKEKLLQKIECYSNPTAHSSYDSFICVFLSHGKRSLVKMEGRDDVGNFITAYDGEVHLEMIYEKFIGEKCTSLIGKPKIFIVQVNFNFSWL